MDRMHANFHSFRTTDKENDRFIISDNGAAKNGAPIRKNQAKMLFNPVDVLQSASKMLNNLHSKIGSNASVLLQLHFIPGAA